MNTRSHPQHGGATTTTTDHLHGAGVMTTTRDLVQLGDGVTITTRDLVQLGDGETNTTELDLPGDGETITTNHQPGVVPHTSLQLKTGPKLYQVILRISLSAIGS